MPETESNSCDLNINNAAVLSTDPTSPNFLQPKRHGGDIDKGTDIGYPYTGTAPTSEPSNSAPTPQASRRGRRSWLTIPDPSSAPASALSNLLPGAAR